MNIKNESKAKMNVLPAKEINDNKTQLNLFYVPKNVFKINITD